MIIYERLYQEVIYFFGNFHFCLWFKSWEYIHLVIYTKLTELFPTMFLIDGIVDSDSHLTSSFSWLFVSFPHLCFVSLAEPFLISLGRQRVQCEMWLGLWNVLSCWSPCSGPGAGRSDYTNKQHNLYLSFREASLYQCQGLSFPWGSGHRGGDLGEMVIFSQSAPSSPNHVFSPQCRSLSALPSHQIKEEAVVHGMGHWPETRPLVVMAKEVLAQHFSGRRDLQEPKPEEYPSFLPTLSS